MYRGFVGVLIGIASVGLLGNGADQTGPLREKGFSPPVNAGKSAWSVEVGDPYWLAVRHFAEAERHSIEALRYEEEAIQVNPFLDSQGHRRNKLLASADAHWIQMINARTLALLYRGESAQRSPR